MADVIIKGMEMRSACGGETDCFALDERGDYPMCRITGETRGYTFPVRERRMDNCPLRPAPKWISVEERLPEDKEIVLVYWNNIHCYTRDNYSVMRFHKGRTEEELKAVKFICSCDQWGNNKKPYCWSDPHGPMSLFGQDVTHWMPLPEPPKEMK